MLRYTGHPLVDVGVATITAFANKSDPSDVNKEDLLKIAKYIEQEYGKNPMKSFLTVIFPNSGFTQPAFDKQPEKRAAYARSVLLGWSAETPVLDEQCVFFNTPAIARVYREAIPLIGAESGFNFYAEATPGLPVSGLALLAIQAFPLGCVKCSGRVLLIHAEDPQLTYHFAIQALKANRRYLNMSAQADKHEDAKYPRTQIIERLLQAEEARRDSEVSSVTAYHLTNYGTNASVDIYHIPLQITRFLVAATDATYRKVWQQVVRRGWEGGREEPERDVFGLPAHRNVLYEDLFALPRDARRFLRTYMLRMPKVLRSKDDPRATYKLTSEIDLVSWQLTELFLKEVMNVDKSRIEAIRTMADRIANYIQEEDDKSLLRLFLSERNSYTKLRMRLIQTDFFSARKAKPLFTLDEFIDVFDHPEDRLWWMLARDLILIRMIETLHMKGWIRNNKDVLTRNEDSDDDEGDEG